MMSSEECPTIFMTLKGETLALAIVLTKKWRKLCSVPRCTAAAVFAFFSCFHSRLARSRLSTTPAAGGDSNSQRLLLAASIF